MMLTLLSLLSIFPLSDNCLQCDRRIRRMQEDYILSASKISDQIAMKNIRDHAYETYKSTSKERQGIIDPTTMYRARTEYQSEFDRFLKGQRTASMTFGAIYIMDKGRKILEKHLDTFIKDRLCPNKCGLLKQRVLDCISCRYKIHICSSGQLDCGEHPVQAEEGGQAVMDCFRQWHSRLIGRPEYHFSWAPGVPGNKTLNDGDFKLLIVTDDSSVVLNQLRVNEQGTYRCSLQGRNGTVFYRLHFLLTVSPVSHQADRAAVALPPPPPLYTDGPLVPVLIIVTVLSLAASGGLTLLVGRMIYQRGAEEEVRRKKKEGRRAQNAAP